MADDGMKDANEMNGQFDAEHNEDEHEGEEIDEFEGFLQKFKNSNLYDYNSTMTAFENTDFHRIISHLYILLLNFLCCVRYLRYQEKDEG